MMTPILRRFRWPWRRRSPQPVPYLRSSPAIVAIIDEAAGFAEYRCGLCNEIATGIEYERGHTAVYAWNAAQVVRQITVIVVQPCRHRQSGNVWA